MELAREELDKSPCWIDLAISHSGDWTEGMKKEDREVYMRVYRKRLESEKEESVRLQEYAKAGMAH